MKMHTLLAMIALAATDFAATAGITANYTGANSFSVNITGMPDFDQFRVTLSNDGKSYCVPTASMNIFAYAANHGFPEVLPGPGNWQSQGNYFLATVSIAVTGGLMGTDPVSGTTVKGQIAGSKTIISLSKMDRLCVQHIYTDLNKFIRLHQLAEQVALGGLVNFSYGRYSLVGSSGNVFELAVNEDGKLIRDGGHAITLDGAGISEPFAPFYVTSRDPAKPDVVDGMQSTFESLYSNVFSLSFRNGPSGGTVFAADTMYWEPSNIGTIRLIDSEVALRPCGALRFSSIQPGQLQLSIVTAGSFGVVPSPTTISSAFGIVDLAFSPDALQAIALVTTSITGGATQLRCINLVTGAQTPIGSLTGLRGIAIGRDGRIYAHDGISVYAYWPDGTAAGSFTPPGTPSAIAYDDLRDRVVVLSVARRTVSAFNRELLPVAELVIPGSVPMFGTGSLTVVPEDGAVFFITGGSNAICRVGPGMTATDVSLSAVSGVTAPQCIAAGDGGRLWVSSQGSIRALALDPQGRWMQDASSPFHLLPDQGPIAIMRSRTNYDPAQHSGPGWRELTMEELGSSGFAVADCIGDLDGNRLIDGADLAWMLSNWGQTSPTSVAVSFDYVGNGAGSWASDMVLMLSDGAQSPVAWGGYDSLLGGSVDGGEWPFYGSGSALSGHYSATVQLPPGAVLSGAGPWSVTVGNGWSTSPSVQYRNVQVTLFDPGMPALVTVADQASTGGQSVSRGFASVEIEGDLDADGQVDSADLGYLLLQWGNCDP